MLDVVSLLLSLIAIVSGMYLIFKNSHHWDFSWRELGRSKEALIYTVVALSTAACLGQFFMLLSSTFEHTTTEQLTQAIQRVVGSISICGFHVLAAKSLEEIQ